MCNDNFSLWHYTDLTGLEGIISSQCLWATDYRYLNDSSELHHSQKMLFQVLLPKVIAITKKKYDDSSEVRGIIDFHNGVEKFSEMATWDHIKRHYKSFLESPNTAPIPCVLSFCKTPKDERNGLLSQWRGYGKDGGYAVIFDEKELDKKFNEDEDCFYGISGGRDVVYAPPVKDKEIKDSLEQVSGYIYQYFKEQPREQTKDEFFAFIRCMAFIKHNGFSEEREYRFLFIPDSERFKNMDGFKEAGKEFRKIMFRESSRGLVPYIKLFERSKPLPIEGICIGPYKDKKLREQSVKMYLRNKGLEHIEVFCSETPFVG